MQNFECNIKNEIFLNTFSQAVDCPRRLNSLTAFGQTAPPEAAVNSLWKSVRNIIIFSNAFKILHTAALQRTAEGQQETGLVYVNHR